MERHEFLKRLHAVIRPRNYLEIGVQTGASLRYSRVPSIGVDPAFRIEAPICCDVRLVRTTSDEFFAAQDPIQYLRSSRNPLRNARRGRPLFDHWLGGTRLDLAFIDGMHLFEFALRDFMNVERFADWSSVIVFDDMFPRDAEEASRERQTSAWTGDVFKVMDVLAKERPDLVTIPVDTAPTGLLVVLGADPASTVLAARFDAIVAEQVRGDPQDVPDAILERRSAVDPEALFASGLFGNLAQARRRHRRRGPGIQAIRRDLAAIRSGPVGPVVAAGEGRPA